MYIHQRLVACTLQFLLASLRIFTSDSLLVLCYIPSLYPCRPHLLNFRHMPLKINNFNFLNLTSPTTTTCLQFTTYSYFNYNLAHTHTFAFAYNMINVSHFQLLTSSHASVIVIYNFSRSSVNHVTSSFLLFIFSNSICYLSLIYLLFYSLFHTRLLF